MKIVFAPRNPNPYTKRNATTGALSTVFVYHVEGTEKELAAYKASKGENYREDEKAGHKPLFFTTNCPGHSAELVKNSKGEFVADDQDMKTFAGLEAKYGTTLAREEFAKIKAARVVEEVEEVVTKKK